MAHKSKKPSPSHKFLSESSSTNYSRRRHRRLPTKEHQIHENYTENSDSPSPYQSQEDESEPPMDASCTDSPSEPRCSESVPRSRSGLNNPEVVDSRDFPGGNFEPYCSYINVAPLPIFHGNSNECPVSHLSRFIKVCRANNVEFPDALMRIFPVTLESEAALWYDLNIEPYFFSLSWEEMKSSFLQAYQQINLTEQLRHELMMMNQGREESVRSYFLRLQWILKRWLENGIEDNLVKGVFVDGLKEEIQEWVIPQKPETLKEALRLAFGYEQVKRMKGSDMKCGFCEGRHEERWCGVRERMREFWRRNCRENFSGGEEGKETGKLGSPSMGDYEISDEKGDDGGEEGMTMLNEKKKSQCQCLKHQCWKKKIDRNSSFSDSKSVPDC